MNDFEYDGARDHQVRLTVDDGYLSVKLVCPEQGCAPGHSCSHCGHVYGDDEDEPCYDCKGVTPKTECWLRTWFDALTPDELLRGKAEFLVSVDVGWDQDHPEIVLRPDAESSRGLSRQDGAA